MVRRLGVVLAMLAALAVAPPAHAATPLHRSEARDSVDAARAAYETAGAKVVALSDQDQQVTANAEAAEATAQTLRDEVDGDGGLVGAVRGLFGGESDLDRAAEAADNAADARAIADMVHDALVEQMAATEQARRAWERAERRRARVEAAFSASEYADAALERAHFLPAYDVTGAQDRRNLRALRAWQGYLHDLAAAAVVPPPATELADPTHLPDGLAPARDAHNELAPGIATARSVTVISAEAVRAVSEAFRRVGLPEVPGATTPSAYACGGLVSTAWAGPRLTPPADAAGQYQQLRSVPASSVEMGDVVVLGSRKDGLAETGVYVGRNQVVLADPTTGTAAVRPLTRDLLGVRRVGIGLGQHAPAPAGGTCGVTVAAHTETDGPFGLPVAPGTYHLTAGFGDPGSRWSSGEHTGLDFAAPIGTPVVAVGAGTVTIEHPDWAGNLVRIDHGGGVETLYAHLSRVDVTDGQVLAAGEQLGLVGEEGNASGPHVHLEVRLDGTPYDPALVLGFATGDPCPATPDGLTLMRCDAAVAYRLMGAAYADQFGTAPCLVTGEELTVDLCGGAERAGSPENDWLLRHGPAYGWIHPGTRAEPWHFAYSGGTSG
ncbi:peptidoglycan DD-metalloendopeptidase family protein [Nocardioides sp. HB32]